MSSVIAGGCLPEVFPAAITTPPCDGGDVCLRFCRDIDGDNQRPLLFPEGFFIALSPVLWASGFPSFIYFFSCGVVIGAS